MADRRTRATWAAAFFLVAVVLVFAAIRAVTDAPLIVAGRDAPPGSFGERYVQHPVPAYLHIVPGVLFLLGALHQLARRVRVRALGRHRRLGRWVLGAGLLSGIFGVAFGVPLSLGGAAQATATVVFGTWFLVALLLGLRAARQGSVQQHRRWMIRAFAAGLAVGTIRLWVGLLSGFGGLPLADTFGLSFWAAFLMHVTAGEVWLRWRPQVPERPQAPRRRVRPTAA